MPSETELKYTPPEGFGEKELFSLPEIAGNCGEISETEMRTEYLDTPFSEARTLGITLRRRFEGKKSLLYAKAPVCASGELSIRGEWCVESDDVARAAELLLAEGAPTEALVGKKLCVIGRVSFLRKEARLSLPDFEASLSYDKGIFGKDVSFSEIELELISGDTDELLRFGRSLAGKYDLAPETASKCARAIRYTTE